MPRTFTRLVIASAALSVTTAAADEVVNVGSEPQLFIDDFIVAEMRGVQRVMHSPVKKGLIKNADGSTWERGDVYAGNIVCRDVRGRLHMTYRYMWSDLSVRDLHPSIGEDRAHWYRESIAYAWSDDGIHWVKPKLGLVEGPTGFRKDGDFEVPTSLSKENNLGVPFDFIYDLHAHGNGGDPAHRFLLRLVEKDDTHPFARVIESQLCFAAEWPDFVNDPQWREKLTRIEGGQLSPRGFRSLAGHDAAAQVWFSVSQDEFGSWTQRGGREIARYESPDLKTWSKPRVVLPIAPDESREPHDTIEYMDLLAYRVGGQQTGAWLGQLTVFHSDRSDPQFMMPNAPVWRKGTTELRLVLSRDAGLTWARVGGRQAWLPHHPEPHGYDRLIFATYPVRVGNELWFYYSAWDGDHLVFERDGSLHEPGFMRTGRTALATLRWDGYVSLDAREGATVLTKPLRFAGKSLFVNFRGEKDGWLRAELQDLQGNALAGFSAADCEPVTGDGGALPVRWQGDADLARIARTPVRVSFALEDGAFYGFAFR